MGTQRRHGGGSARVSFRAEDPPPCCLCLPEFYDFRQNLVGLRQLALAVALDKANLALLVEDERGPDVRVPVRPVDAVGLHDAALYVGEERIAAEADRLRPVLVAEGAVRADTQHLGIGRLEVADALVEGGHAGASARRPVERVEQQHHFLPVEVLEADLLEADGLQREVGRRVADVEGLALGGGALLSCPPFAILRVAGALIARRSPTFAGALRAAAHACGRRLSSGASARPR